MSVSSNLVPLAEVANLNPSLETALADNQRVSFVPMAAVSAELASTVGVEERPYVDVAKGYTPFVQGDVLVAKITPCFENGKIAQAVLPHRVGFGSTEFHVVRPRDGKLDARYLLHFLRQERVRRAGERRMTGSAGQRRVPENFLAQLAIPLPTIVKQRRIADILDRAEVLRADRRRSLAALDVLVQSCFLSTFGDPVSNPKGWTNKGLGDVTAKITDGEHLTPKFSPCGMPIVMAGDVLDDRVELANCKRVDQALGERFRRKCDPDPGDLLVVSRGVTIGRSCVVNEGEGLFSERQVGELVSVLERVKAAAVAA